MWLHKICRLCGQSSEIMRSIFDCNNKQDSFELKLKKCLPIASFTSGDLKPKQVCEHCYNKINEFYNFIVICEAADYEIDRILYEDSEKWYQETTDSEKVSNLDPMKTDLLFDTNSFFNDRDTNFYPLETEVLSQPVKIVQDSVVVNDPETIQNEINKVADIEVNKELIESPVLMKDKIIKNVVEYGSGEKPKPFSCSICNKQFTRQANVASHVIQQHSDSKPFDCDTCDKKFATRRELSIHSRLHTGEHQCTYCKRVFPVRSKLERHMRTHTGEKPFVCSECNKGFSDKRNLDTHMRLHRDERPFECEICNKRFRLKGHLVEHHKVHVTEMGYTCDTCGKQFKWQANLHLHLQEHQGKVNKCRMCNVTFTRRTQLNKHMNRCERRMEYLNDKNNDDCDVNT